MSDRYEKMFESRAAAGEGAFVPFTVLGDPDSQCSLEIVRQLAQAGADALELGIPFSDPIADGPTIQAADVRALEAGIRMDDALGIVQTIREEFAALPIGLLVYANLVEGQGRQRFYEQVARAGVDSVLVADVPTLEAEPFAAAARAEGVLPVLIAPPTAEPDQLKEIAYLSRGYTYVVTRAGVTGADEQAQVDHRSLLVELKRLGAPPALLGFGISRPEHVRAALEAGAAGAISGSAVVRIIQKRLENREKMLADLAAFVRTMKHATRPL